MALALSCPTPLRHYPNIVLGHGSGGRMMQDLLEQVIIPGLSPAQQQGPLTDAAVLLPPEKGMKLALTTDSFVINPPIFPGGDIGSLAVHGTVNDLAMMGAIPQYLSAAFIIEEGLSMDTLKQIVTSMAQAAVKAGVTIVTGDTKVVEHGHGDQIFITTTGVGFIPKHLHLSPLKIVPGDVLIVNGTLGDHGMTIMSLRHGLEFDTALISDSAPLNGLTSDLLAVYPKIHTLRDITRGGLAAVANELAVASNTSFVIDESSVPIRPSVQSACEILGLDPFHVANEGKFLAIVPKRDATAVLAAMKQHPLGKDAAIIGQVQAQPSQMVLGNTVIGSDRVIDFPPGELLPRIC